MLPSDRLIGLTKAQNDIIAAVYESLEIGACKFRRTHEYYLEIVPVQAYSASLSTS